MFSVENGRVRRAKKAEPNGLCFFWVPRAGRGGDQNSLQGVPTCGRERRSMKALIKQLVTRRLETSDRAILLWLRWLFFLVLWFLFLYSLADNTPSSQMYLRVSLLA